MIPVDFSLLAAGSILLALCMSCNLLPEQLGGAPATPSPTPNLYATATPPATGTATPQPIITPHATATPQQTTTPRAATPTPTPAGGRLDIPNGDFESGTYAHWTVADTAFGTAPSDLEYVNANMLYLDMPYTAYHGQFAASSYLPNRDAGARGTLTSEEFTVSRRYLEFLYTGMQNAQISVEVFVEGAAVKHFEVDNPSTRFQRASLDLGTWTGKQAHIVVADGSATKPHGYIEVDDFYLIDAATVTPE